MNFHIKKLKSPSPKVLQTVMAVVFVIVATITYQNYKNKGFFDRDETPQKSLSVVVENTQTEIDTDGDGLADWEEALWGTEINNPDTDGDGTLDGVETELNRDPTMAGPDDFIETQINSDDLSFGSSTIDANSFTMNAGIDLFRAALESSVQGGGLVNEQLLIENLDKQSENFLSIENQYNIEDLNIISDNSISRLSQYLKNILNIFESEYLKADSMVSQNPDPNMVMLEIHENIETRLSAIPIPEVLSNSHLKLINSLKKVVYYYGVTLNEEGDPLLAYYSIAKMREEINNSNKYLEEILIYLKNSGIILERNENQF